MYFSTSYYDGVCSCTSIKIKYDENDAYTVASFQKNLVVLKFNKFFFWDTVKDFHWSCMDPNDFFFGIIITVVDDIRFFFLVWISIDFQLLFPEGSVVTWFTFLLWTVLGKVNNECQGNAKTEYIVNPFPFAFFLFAVIIPINWLTSNTTANPPWVRLIITIFFFFVFRDKLAE